jgi:SM-20-related protein
VLAPDRGRFAVRGLGLTQTRCGCEAISGAAGRRAPAVAEDCVERQTRHYAAVRPRRPEALLSLIDIGRLCAAPLHREPFDFVVVDDFIHRERLPALIAEFPTITRNGSFPIDEVCGGPSFARLAGELGGPALRQAVEEKFAIDLTGRPTMITLRGVGDGKDGRIHTDSATKIITLLLYLNPVWEASGGRLRLLRGPDDLADFAAEVPPVAGTMVAFRRSDRSFHGHLPHVGPRRSLQLNWVTDERVVRRELARHRWSARWKGLNPLG